MDLGGYGVEFSYALTFVSGLLADLLRRVFLPESERWLDRVLPWRRKASNTRENLQSLEIRKKLRDLGLDSQLASHIGDNASDFFAKIEAAGEREKTAYTEVMFDALGSEARTQAEMNAFSFDRFAAADRLLESRFDQIMVTLSDDRTSADALAESQNAFLLFREKDAVAEAKLTADGGTMEPLIHAAAMESATVSRLGRLRELERLATGGNENSFGRD